MTLVVTLVAVAVGMAVAFVFDLHPPDNILAGLVIGGVAAVINIAIASDQQP